MDVPTVEAGGVGEEPTPDVPAPRRSRWRTVLVAIMVTLSGLTVAISSVSVWAHRTVFNTDQWVATVGPLAQNDAVVASVSTRLTQELDQLLQPEQRAANLLPQNLKGLAAPIGEGFDQVISATVTRLLRSQQFQRFWIAANRTLQPVAAAALLGNPTKHLLTSNGTVQLNLLPLIATALSTLDKHVPALVPTQAPIPTITSTTPPDQARAELSYALGRPLSENFGTITLLRSSQLATAQGYVNVFNAAIVAIVIVTAGLLVGAVVVSQRRRRTLIALAVAVVVGMAAALALTRAIANAIVSAITNPGSKGAVRATVDAIIGSLSYVTVILIVVGLVIIIVAFLVGPSRVAVSARRQSSAAAKSLMARGPDAPPSAVVTWVGRYQLLLGLLGLGIGAVLLIFVVEGWVGLLVTALVVAAYEVLVAWVGHRAASSSPAAPAE